MGKDVIIACDFASAEQTFAFLDKFTGRKPFVKTLFLKRVIIKESEFKG